MNMNTSFHSAQEEAMIAKEVLKKLNPEALFRQNESTYVPKEEPLGHYSSQFSYPMADIECFANPSQQYWSTYVLETEVGLSVTNATSLKDNLLRVVKWVKDKKEIREGQNTFSIPDELEGAYLKENKDEEICLLDGLEARLKPPKTERRKIKVRVKRIEKMAPRIQIDDEWAEWL